MNKINTSNPKLDQYLNVISSSVKKFRALIKELSTIGKIENDTFNTELIDVEKMIDEIKTRHIR